MKGFIYSSAVVLICLAGCKPEQAKPPTATTSNMAAGFSPVPLPDPHIPGFRFPEPQATIDNWVANNDQASMSKHAWGVWTALTADSGETYDGQPLRVFETWLTPGDLTPTLNMESLATTPRNPRPLGSLHQFEHGAAAGQKSLQEVNGQTVTGFVKYDPTAAAAITSGDLFSAAKLSSYLEAGTIPDFPNTAIALKPVFQPLPSSKAVDGRYAQLANWPGPPQSPVPFPASAWKQCVWIDLQEQGDGPGTGAVDTTCKTDGSSRTPASTYGLGRFIHFQLTAPDAARLNTFLQSLGATESAPALTSTGDYAVLLAMHMTTREITRWTWATFFWTPTPDAPPAPSSKAIAALRPSQLTGPARSYAHCVADMMLDPAQPNTGGKNVGNSVYCYNPWLEAGFSPSDLPDSEPGTFDGKVVKNDVGVQTNCMSCHAQANFNPKKVQNAPQYAADRYVDIQGKAFRGTVRVDFLWSVADNAK